MMQHGFLIAAPQSGSGKTTVCLAILAGLKRSGLRAAPFKCGPDFIDPGYHRQAAGQVSINLDAWMCPESFVRDTFRLYSREADVAVIEAVMGLFDGIGAAPMEGSSAQIAALTGAPVVLVVNARGMAASAAALVKGFAEFDARVRLAGVIFNNVGSASHAELLQQAMHAALPDIRLFGCIPRDESLAIPSRHLGLVTVEDNPLQPEFLERLALLAEQHLDLTGLAELEIMLPSTPFPSTPLRERGALLCGVDNRVISVDSWVSGVDRRVSGVEPRIAVARDAAFCFVYEDNLRLLREAGAEIVAFSPLNDETLPADINGIYLPGGYPELFSDRLAANTSMLVSIRAAVEQGMPLYAECGGFIYLTEGMADAAGSPLADFVGIFPVRAQMLAKRKALGYRQVEITADTLFGSCGETARGHEFHYSEVSSMPEQIERCYRVTRQGKVLSAEGYRHRNCLASYVHLHFGSNTGIAQAFVAACGEYGKSSGKSVQST